MPKEKIAPGVDGSAVSEGPARQPHIKERRFAKILEKLYHAIIHEKGLFASVKMETHAPQIKYYPGSPNLVPKDLHREHQIILFPKEEKHVEVVMPRTLLHRRWLWFGVHEDLQDGSELVYRSHCRLYADHPEFYNPEVLEINAKEFARIIKEKDPNGKVKYKIGEAKRVVRDWQTCAKTLYEEFDGDPVKLLSHAGWGVEKVYQWKKEERRKRGYDPIPGWGRKLISLYFFYLADLGYVLPEDAFPADLHAQALLLQTGSFDWGDKEVIYSAPLAEMIRKFVTTLCMKKGWDALILGHAQWLKGSFLCNGCSNNKLVPQLCAVFKECGGRIDTGSYSAGKWYKNNRVHTKSGDRPKFGLPTDHPPRLTRARKRKLQGKATPQTIHLFIGRRP